MAAPTSFAPLALVKDVVDSSYKSINDQLDLIVNHLEQMKEEVADIKNK
jgi:hypothetical protein